jgi:hypothetical protein
LTYTNIPFRKYFLPNLKYQKSHDYYVLSFCSILTSEINKYIFL